MGSTMNFIDELKQAMYDISLTNKSGREKVAHFCRHDGIHIRFTKARTIWHANTPSAVKPWWLLLQPTKTTSKTRVNKITNDTHNNNNLETEVIDNA
jgi:hypothetical protein